MLFIYLFIHILLIQMHLNFMHLRDTIHEPTKCAIYTNENRNVPKFEISNPMNEINKWINAINIITQSMRFENVNIMWTCTFLWNNHKKVIQMNYLCGVTLDEATESVVLRSSMLQPSIRLNHRFQWITDSSDSSHISCLGETLFHLELLLDFFLE